MTKGLINSTEVELKVLKELGMEPAYLAGFKAGLEAALRYVDQEVPTLEASVFLAHVHQQDKLINLDWPRGGDSE